MSLSDLFSYQQRENIRRQKTPASTIETSVPESFINRETLLIGSLLQLAPLR